MKHIIKTSATFTAEVEVEAETVEQAEKIVMEDLGCVGTNWHTTNDNAVRDWKADLHPERKIIRKIRPTAVKGGDECFTLTGIDWAPQQSQSMFQNAKAIGHIYALSSAFTWIISMFNMFEDLQGVEIDVSTESDYDDQGGSFTSYRTSVKASWALEADDAQRDEDFEVMVEADFQDQSELKAICYHTVDSKLVVAKSDVQRFLTMDCFDVVEAIKAIGSNEKSGVEMRSFMHLVNIEN